MHAHIADFQPEAFEQRLESLLEPEPAMIGADRDGSFRRCGNGNLVSWHLDDAHPARRRHLARRGVTMLPSGMRNSPPGGMSCAVMTRFKW